jgi:hypothetical protein
MSLKKMPLKTLSALMEAQYVYCTLCLTAHEQLKDQRNVQPYITAGSLAKEQFDVLYAEYERRRGKEKAEHLVATFHDKLNQEKINEPEQQ